MIITQCIPLLPFSSVVGAPLQVFILWPKMPHLLHLFLLFFSKSTSSLLFLLLILGLPGGLKRGGGSTENWG